MESLTSQVGIDGTNTTLNSGRLLITLKPYQDRVPAHRVIERLKASISDIEGLRLHLQPVQDLTIEDRVSQAQYQFTIEAPDSALLDAWNPKILEKLRALPEIKDVQSNFAVSSRTLQLEIDRDTASRLGITMETIAQTLYDAFGQRQIITRYSQINQYRVILEVEGRFQSDPESIRNIYVPGANGRSIPLAGLLHEAETTGRSVIHRQSQFPAATFSFNLGAHASLGDAVHAVETGLSDLNLPKSLRVDFQGTALAFLGALENQLPLLLAAVICVYILLGMQVFAKSN